MRLEWGLTIGLANTFVGRSEPRCFKIRDHRQGITVFSFDRLHLITDSKRDGFAYAIGAQFEIAERRYSSTI